MGCSLLSIVELFYFLFIGIVRFLSNQKMSKVRVIQDIEANAWAKKVDNIASLNELDKKVDNLLEKNDLKIDNILKRISCLEEKI